MSHVRQELRRQKASDTLGAHLSLADIEQSDEETASLRPDRLNGRQIRLARPDSQEMSTSQAAPLVAEGAIGQVSIAKQHLGKTSVSLNKPT